MQPKVTLVGRLPRPGSIGSSVINLTLGLKKFLSQKHDIHFLCVDIDDDCPESDFLIVEAYYAERDLIKKVKEQSKAQMILSVREVQLPYVDYVFASSNERYSNGEFVGFPIRKDLLRNVTKENIILIDHEWPPYASQPGHLDWTVDIVEWLKDFNTVKMARYEMPKENEIPLTDYETFIKNTDHFKYFIVTHAESYPWGVLDMAYRGIKVLTPKGFIPQILVDKLQIKEFSNRQELISFINDESLPNVNDQFIGFDELSDKIVAKILNQ